MDSKEKLIIEGIYLLFEMLNNNNLNDKIKNLMDVLILQLNVEFLFIKNNLNNLNKINILFDKLGLLISCYYLFYFILNNFKMFNENYKFEKINLLKELILDCFYFVNILKQNSFQKSNLQNNLFLKFLKFIKNFFIKKIYNYFIFKNTFYMISLFGSKIFPIYFTKLINTLQKNNKIFKNKKYIEFFGFIFGILFGAGIGASIPNTLIDYLCHSILLKDDKYTNKEDKRELNISLILLKSFWMMIGSLFGILINLFIRILLQRFINYLIQKYFLNPNLLLKQLKEMNIPEIKGNEFLIKILLKTIGQFLNNQSQHIMYPKINHSPIFSNNNNTNNSDTNGSDNKKKKREALNVIAGLQLPGVLMNDPFIEGMLKEKISLATGNNKYLNYFINYLLSKYIFSNIQETTTRNEENNNLLTMPQFILNKIKTNTIVEKTSDYYKQHIEGYIPEVPKENRMWNYLSTWLAIQLTNTFTSPKVIHDKSGDCNNNILNNNEVIQLLFHLSDSIQQQYARRTSKL
ncbi:hypothetical protein ABK040_008438 [Willaertia magna]